MSEDTGVQQDKIEQKITLVEDTEINVHNMGLYGARNCRRNYILNSIQIYPKDSSSLPS